MRDYRVKKTDKLTSNITPLLYQYFHSNIIILPVMSWSPDLLSY